MYGCEAKSFMLDKKIKLQILEANKRDQGRSNVLDGTTKHQGFSNRAEIQKVIDHAAFGPEIQSKVSPQVQIFNLTKQIGQLELKLQQLEYEKRNSETQSGDLSIPNKEKILFSRTSIGSGCKSHLKSTMTVLSEPLEKISKKRMSSGRFNLTNTQRESLKSISDLQSSVSCTDLTKPQNDFQKVTALTKTRMHGDKRSPVLTSSKVQIDSRSEEHTSQNTKHESLHEEYDQKYFLNRGNLSRKSAHKKISQLWAMKKQPNFERVENPTVSVDKISPKFSIEPDCYAALKLHGKQRVRYRAVGNQLHASDILHQDRFMNSDNLSHKKKFKRLSNSSEVSAQKKVKLSSEGPARSPSKHMHPTEDFMSLLNRYKLDLSLRTKIGSILDHHQSEGMRV